MKKWFTITTESLWIDIIRYLSLFSGAAILVFGIWYSWGASVYANTTGIHHSLPTFLLYSAVAVVVAIVELAMGMEHVEHMYNVSYIAERMKRDEERETLQAIQR